MPELPHIPLRYKEGVYGVSEFAEYMDTEFESQVRRLPTCESLV